MNKTHFPNGIILKPQGFGGEYRLIVRDGLTGHVTRETDWFDNLVTNTGLDAIGASTTQFASFCRIGTGNTAAAYTDTVLVSQSASTSSVVARTGVNAGASNYETKTTVTFQFALGAVVGNMAEIGVGTASTGATLCSRALIVDGGGSPTTITVLVTEILQVVYRFTCYPNLVDATGTVTIGGVSYNYVCRTFGAATALGVDPNLGLFFNAITNPNAYPSTSTLGAITATGPSGTSVAFGAGSSFAAYTSGNYYRDLTVSASISEANAAGGIAAISFQVGSASGPIFQNQISYAAVSGGGPIPKDATKALTITIRQPYSHH